VLTAEGRAAWTLALAAPLPILAFLGHAWWIPRVGPIGAAAVTTCCSLLGALAALLAVHRASRATAPLATVLRTALVGAAAYAFGAAAPDGALPLVLWLAAGALGVPAAYVLLGEIAAEERTAVYAWLRQRASRT
jgi:hypothetical protein